MKRGQSPRKMTVELDKQPADASPECAGEGGEERARSESATKAWAPEIGPLEPTYKLGVGADICDPSSGRVGRRGSSGLSGLSERSDSNTR